MEMSKQCYAPASRVLDSQQSKNPSPFQDNRSSFLSQAKMVSVLQRAGEGGAYCKTTKSDAHHMPSARAVAAIIVANQHRQQDPEDPDKTIINSDVADYRTLAVNKIYRDAPAVWMPHDAHVSTRTYGGKSSGALAEDLPIIRDNTPAVAFDNIQAKDVANCRSLTSHTDTMTGLNNIDTASADTKTNIDAAIASGKDIMAQGNSENTRMIPAVDVLDAIESLKRISASWDAMAAGINEIAGTGFCGETYRLIGNGTTKNVQKRTADAIRLAFEHLVV